MCLIMYRKSGQLDKQDFETGLTRNREGLGVMWVENNRVVVKKTVVKTQYDDLFEELNEQPGVKLLHMRLATDGSTDAKRSHPFQILSKDEGDEIDLWLMHNGILGSVWKETVRSDTQIFAEEYLTPILKQNPELLHTTAFQMMIEDFIGTTNKLVFLDSNERVTVINEQAGLWSNGTWLSSAHYVGKYPVTQGVVHTYGDRDTFRKTTTTKTKTTPQSSYNYGYNYGTTANTSTTSTKKSTTTGTTTTTVKPNATTTTAKTSTTAKASTGATGTVANTTTSVCNSSLKTGNEAKPKEGKVEATPEKKPTNNCTTGNTEQKQTTTVGSEDKASNTTKPAQTELAVHCCDNCEGMFPSNQMNQVYGEQFQLCDDCHDWYLDECEKFDTAR